MLVMTAAQKDETRKVGHLPTSEMRDEEKTTLTTEESADVSTQHVTSADNPDGGETTPPGDPYKLVVHRTAPARGSSIPLAIGRHNKPDLDSRGQSSGC